MGDKVGENPAALRAAVFLLSSKNLRGGRSNAPPPSRARVNEGLSVPGLLYVEADHFGQQVVRRKHHGAVAVKAARWRTTDLVPPYTLFHFLFVTPPPPRILIG